MRCGSNLIIEYSQMIYQDVNNVDTDAEAQSRMKGCIRLILTVLCGFLPRFSDFHHMYDRIQHEFIK